MADQEYTFAQARTRLEEIVTQVRGKDMTLEKSLDLLEEGVRLANTCTELSDHTEWRSVVDEQPELESGAQSGSGAGEPDPIIDGAPVAQAAAGEASEEVSSAGSKDSATEDSEHDEDGAADVVISEESEGSDESTSE